MSDFDRDYEEAVSGLDAFRIALEGMINVFLEQQGINVHSVTSRVKQKASVLRKLQRPDKDRHVSELTDLLGVRIITYFPDEVDKAAKLVEREFRVDPDNSVDKRSILDPDRFGYLSLHYVLTLNEKRSELTEYQNYKSVKFELQIRSILQHAWAEIEHDLGYKSESTVPRAARRRFSRLAGLLELADAEFQGIREQLASSANLQRSSSVNLQYEVDRVLTRPGLVSLPVWTKTWSESEYLSYVAVSDSRFVLLDRVLIGIPSSRQGRFEACDLFGPNNELIHIRRASSSAAFGHLFNQAQVSTEILIESAEARKEFASKVKQLDADRILATDFRPKDVIVAFPSDRGVKIPDFALRTLVRVALALENLGATLRILTIDINLHDGGTRV